MTTIRIRALRKKTRDLMATAGSGQFGEGAAITSNVNPVEVLVYGSVRAVVHFPKGQPTTVWTAVGWQEFEALLKNAANHARKLADASESLWKAEAREAGQEARA